MASEDDFVMWGDACMQCGKTKEEAGPLLRCSRCRCAIYCGQDCQRAAFDQHKRYCKRMTYWPNEQLRGSDEARKKVDPAHPRLAAAREALEDEPADRRAQFIQAAAGMAENFYRALQGDILVSEDEEGLWGLRGQPGTPGYQRVYSAWQHAAKYSDLTATRLFEALTAAPSSSAALTRLLGRDVRMVCTDDDNLETLQMVVERHLANTRGLAVDSDVDRLPLGPYVD